MRYLTILLLLICISFTWASEPDVVHRLGLSGGFPQLVAITYQASFSKNLSIDAHLSPLVLINTAGCRLIWGDTSEGFHPRLFAGIAVFDMRYADSSEDPIGAESYLWTGAGLGYSFSHARIYADLGYTAEGAKDRGLGYRTGVDLSGGILFNL